MSLFFLLTGYIFSVKDYDEGDRDEEGAHIRDRLCCLNADPSDGKREKEYHGKEEDSLTAACKKRCDCLESESLIELIDEGAERHKGYADREETESFGTDGGNLRVIAEEPHYLLGEDSGEESEEDADTRADLDREGEAFPGTIFIARAEIVACGRLKALTETDDDVADEHIYLICDRDSGTRCFRTVVDSLYIERGGCDACESLAEDRGDTRGHDGGVIGEVSADALYVDLYDRLSEKEEAEEDREADGLAYHRCDRGTSRAHIAAVDEDRVEDHIQNSARGDADHRKEGKSLASESCIEDEGRAVEGCGDQNESRVGNGVRDHQIGASEEAEDRLEEGKTYHCDYRTDDYRCGKRA